MPSYYRKVDSLLWGDKKFRTKLSPMQPSGQALWLWLLTGPRTTSLPGLLAVGEAAAAEELGWPLESFRNSMADIIREGMAKADWTARVIWLPNAVRYNRPRAPNVVISWGKLFSLIPECELRDEAWQAYEALMDSMGKGFPAAFAEAFGDYMPNNMGHSNPHSGAGAGVKEKRREEKSAKSAEAADDAPPLELSTESTEDLDPPILEFPVRGSSKTWPVRRSQISKWAQIYKGIDVEGEIRKAVEWVHADSRRKKTSRGMQKFLTGWLARGQGWEKDRKSTGGRAMAALDDYEKGAGDD